MAAVKVSDEVKVAVTVAGEVPVVTLQVTPEVEVQPLQLTKVEPVLGVAVRTTAVEAT